MSNMTPPHIQSHYINKKKKNCNKTFISYIPLTCGNCQIAVGQFQKIKSWCSYELINSAIEISGYLFYE